MPDIYLGQVDVDVFPPVIENLSPAAGETDVALNATIEFDLVDQGGSGVKLSSVLYQVGGENAIVGGVIQGGFCSGSLTPITNGYHVLVNPHADFAELSGISNYLEAEDNAAIVNKLTTSWSFTTTTTAPKVVNVVARDEHTIRVYFDQQMKNDSALLRASNYVLVPVTPGAAPVYVGSVQAQVATYPLFVDLLTTEMTNGMTYRVVVSLSGPKSKLDQFMAPGYNEREFLGRGVNPQLLRVYPVDVNHVQVIFDELMLDSEDLRNVANYEFDNGLEALAVVAVYGDRVTLLTTDQEERLLYTLTVYNGVSQVFACVSNVEFNASADLLGAATWTGAAELVAAGVRNFYDSELLLESAAEFLADGDCYEGMIFEAAASWAAAGEVYSATLLEATSELVAAADTNASATWEAAATFWAQPTKESGYFVFMAAELIATGEIYSGALLEGAAELVAAGEVYSATLLEATSELVAAGEVYSSAAWDAQGTFEATGAVLSSATMEAAATLDATGEVYSAASWEAEGTFLADGLVLPGAHLEASSELGADGLVLPGLHLEGGGSADFGGSALYPGALTAEGAAELEADGEVYSAALMSAAADLVAAGEVYSSIEVDAVAAMIADAVVYSSMTTEGSGSMLADGVVGSSSTMSGQATMIADGTVI